MALVGEWSFDEGTGTDAADSSGNNNTLTGIPGWSVSGHTNACMQNTGTAGPTLTGLSFPTGAYTLMAWVYFTSFLGWQSVFEGTGGSLYFEVNATGDFDVWNGVHGGYSVATLQLNTWYHLTYTQDATTAYVYVDGVQVDTPVPGTVMPTTVSVFGSSGQPCTGRCDDVRIYDSLLTVGEVNTAMTTPVSSTGSGSVGAATASFDFSGTAEASYNPEGTAVGVMDWSAPVTHPFITSVSANNRYLLDQYGDPILVKGDTIWSMPVSAGSVGYPTFTAGTRTWQEDMDWYASNRQAQGYNMVVISLLGSTQNRGPSDTGATWDGVLPWNNSTIGDLNETYWQRLDYFLTTCENHGITVFADAVYAQDLGAALSTVNTTTATNYGTALGNRWQNRPNLVWMVGGDWFDDPSENTIATAFFNGVEATGDTHLKTVQNYPNTAGRRERTSGTWDPLDLASTWADIDYVYSYLPTYLFVEGGYETTPAAPTIWGDGMYHNGDDESFNVLWRNMLGWALTSGGCGSNYGGEGTWGWSAPDDVVTNQVATVQQPAMRAAIESRPYWWDLVPDLNSSFLTAGRGTKASLPASSGVAAGEYSGGGTYVTGAKTPDGRLAVIYMPNAATTLTVDTTQMATGYTTTWVDPTNGTEVTGTNGTTFTRATANAAGAADWLLILEAEPPTLTAQAVSGTQVDLSWTSVTGAAGYDIERNDVVIVNAHPTTSYSDTGLTPNTEYTYRVRAV